MQAVIPPQTFFGHVQKLLDIWSEKHDQDQKFDSIIITNGKATSGNQKTIAIMSWFLAGYNLADTIIFFNQSEIIIYTSERKIAFLSNIKDHPNAKKYNLSFVKKDQDSKAAFQKIWSSIHTNKSKPKIGMLLNDAKSGAIAEEFEKFVSQQKYQPFQIFTFFNECVEKKDESEIQNLKKSGRVTAYFQDKFIKQVQKVIDSGKGVKHSDLCKKVVQLMTNEPQLKKCILKLKDFDLNKDYIDVGPTSSIQSGGNFKHKLFSGADDNNLKSDCIVLGMGSLYRSYNTYISRTLLIDPTETQKNIYKKIETLTKVVIQNLRIGVKISDVYKKAKQFVTDNLSSLQMPKSLGFGIGVFLKQSTLSITETNDQVIQAGNTFLVDVTFPQIKFQTKKGEKIFFVQLVDTVIVTQKGQEVITSAVSKLLSDISYSLDEEEQGKKDRIDLPSSSNIIQGGRRRRKNESANQKLKNQKERNEHQNDLKKKKLEELQERINQNFTGDFKKQKVLETSKIQCYKHKQDMPKDMKKNMIYIDNKNNTILLPFKDSHVPFHILILKSVVKNDQGKFASLRFNFHLPNVVSNLAFPKFNETTVFIKQLVFRSQQVNRLTQLEKQVKALQKKIRTEASEKNAKQDIVQQEKLNLNKGKRPMLRDLYPRPGVGQKKTKGNLECHLNGFRYTTSKGQSIDVAFSNIKYAFFQPCQKQIIAAIHFRLHEPIMVAKKKTEDIQFYSQGGTNAEDVVGRGSRGFGRDDSDDQQRQKQARKKVDRQFLAWTRACQQYIGNIFQFQIPNRDKGFYGTPFKGNCLIQPTKTCLINITQIPFFVLSIKQIEVACFERMYANLKSFDVTFVQKDYQQHIRVNSIPIKDVERVKDFLDDNGIIFYDLGKSMNWVKFLGGIRSDFRKFVEDGGWTAWDSDDQQQQMQIQEGDSEFSASDQQLQQDESDFSEEDGESQSNYGQQDDSESGQDEDLSEEGLSWDQMQERAEKEDRERLRRQIQKQKNGGIGGGKMSAPMKKKR